ncbi:MAG TPA: alginate lyase family protein [Hyphomicrobiales bacterium]|nr:alginate lyase family protein [Hyphomicrobiales bacterium]
MMRRLELKMRRSLRDRWPLSSYPAMPAPRHPSPPLPLLVRCPRLLTAETESEIKLNLLGRNVVLKLPGADWNSLASRPEHQLWSMHLHYMEYLTEVTDRLWAALVTDWIAANPPTAPGAWKAGWNSYALSIRTVVWMQELARRTGTLPAGLVRKVEASLAQQMAFLERNLETDIGGNHLIKNIRALAWASAYFEGYKAKRWRQKAVKLLVPELNTQTLADGMHFERSPSYHMQVFVDLLECRQALGQEISTELDPVLERMAQALADLTHPDGKPALFNDAGLTMAPPAGPCLEVYTRLLDRRCAPRRLFALREAGYFGLRSGQSYFVADCGRIGPDALPAHAHGDALSFEWSVGGRRVIVDQGVFEYNEGERRQKSRSAASHNTLCFEGADQADFFGAFRCGRRPNVTLLHYEEREDGFVLEGAHDGFRYLPGSPIHRRHFRAGETRIVIRDKIEGKAGRRAFISYLLHPSIEVRAAGNIATLHHGNASIGMTSTAPIAIEDAVWWPDMGIELPTRRLRVQLDPSSMAAETTFTVLSAGRAADHSARA